MPVPAAALHSWGSPVFPCEKPAIGVAGAGGWLLRRPCSNARTGNVDLVLLSLEGNMPTAILKATNPKRWVVQYSANSEQEGSEEKSNQCPEENNSGPPVLTIIAGLLVLFVVFWALGSLLSWIVGLFFSS